MQHARISHLGICVADLERARRFYCDGLGFTPCTRLAVSGAAAERLLEIEGVALEALYLERDGLRIELLHFAAPGSRGAAEGRPMNALGLTHLSLRVADLPAALPAITAAGGRLLESTRIQSPAHGLDAAFVLDPDGTRIELVQSPGPLDALPGEPA